jgi:hypothetical protein
MATEGCNSVPYNNVAQRWALELIRLTKIALPQTNPPVVARNLAVVSTCQYDSIVPYMEYAKSWSGFNISKRPTSERNEQNMNVSISYASYRAITHLFADYPTQLNETRAIMLDMMLDPDDVSEVQFTAHGIGNLACRKVLELKDVDGFNFLGDEQGTKVSGTRYADYTNYNPVNDPLQVIGSPECWKLRNINSWQALSVPKRNANGTTVQKWAGANVGYARTFSTLKLQDIDLQGPALFSTNNDVDAWRQNAEMINVTSMLDDRRKVIALYWADGPDTTAPPGHWYRVMNNLTIARGMGLTRTVKLFFLVTNAVSDAGILTWAAKRLYDSSRPVTVIPCLYAYTQLKSWKGPYQGVQMIDAFKWIPYQDYFFVTPPFAEWPSGHSSFSGAATQAMKLFFNKDESLGLYAIVKEGSSSIEPKIAYGSTGYIFNVTNVPNKGPETVGYSPAKDFELYWHKMSDAAQCAANSRLFGGIHYKRAADDGLRIGRSVANAVWCTYQDLIGVNRDDYFH